MKVTEKLLKPITEVNYLRAENVDRYRLIMRFFFLEYEKIHYWLHKEDIFEEIRRIPGYASYTLDLCQQDLQALVNWGNLTALQDSNKVRTIQDFKNKKFRYQLTEYAVEIERMIIRLEHLEVEGASLEPTLLERIYKQLSEIEIIIHQEQVDVHGWLTLLMNDFVRLNQNYQDYIKTLNSARAEELMKSTEFLVYKDKIIMYLRTFIVSMQEKGYLIADILKKINETTLKTILDYASLYELSIPRLTTTISYEEVYTNFSEKWQSLYYWFIGKDGVNEMDRLYDRTDEIIRKITRYAQQISEMLNRGSNRKEQYMHIANVFKQCQSIEKAHCLSAYVFGVSDCLHLARMAPRMSEDIHAGVYQENPSLLSFDPHSRIVKKKNIRQPAKDYRLERIKVRLEKEDELKIQRKKIAKLTSDNCIDFSKLPYIDASIRKTLLLWLSKGLSQTNLTNKTDDGRYYYIDKTNAQTTCTIHSEDGDFVLPAFKIIFKGDNL